MTRRMLRDGTSSSTCASHRVAPGLRLMLQEQPDQLAVAAHFGAVKRIPAVQHRTLYEIKSCLVLQPRPAALIDGLEAELEDNRRMMGAARY